MKKSSIITISTKSKVPDRCIINWEVVNSFCSCGMPLMDDGRCPYCSIVIPEDL